MAKKKGTGRECYECHEIVEPGTGRVKYPLPEAERAKLPVREQAWAQAFLHFKCETDDA